MPYVSWAFVVLDPSDFLKEAVLYIKIFREYVDVFFIMRVLMVVVDSVAVVVVKDVGNPELDMRCSRCVLKR